MRRILPALFLVFASNLTGCGPGDGFSSDPSYNSLQKGTTGYTNKDGVPYITNGDTKMDGDLEHPPTAPPTPKTAPTPGKKGMVPKPSAALVERLMEYEISRFMEPSGGDPRVFGNKRIEVAIYFAEDMKNGVRFIQVLNAAGPEYKFYATSGHYTLQGTFTDFLSDDRSEGNLWLSDSATGETVHLRYNSYRADLTVHTSVEKPPGAAIRQRLDDLQNKSYGLVHNWEVARGKAFYLNDIVTKGASTDQGAKLSFVIKGESLRTGDREHPATSSNPGLASNVQLVGNAEGEALRIFSAEIEDPSSHEKFPITLDFERHHVSANAVNNVNPSAGTPPASAAPTTDENQYFAESEDPRLGPVAPPDAAAAETDPETVVNSATAPPAQAAPAGPSPARRSAAPTATSQGNPPPTAVAAVPAIPSKPTVILGTSFLRVMTDNRHPMTQLMARHFARNRYLKGVERFIAQYRNYAHNPNSGTDLKNFFRYAFSMRDLLQNIAEFNDVSPIYAYLTLIESTKYFNNAQFNNREVGDSGLAWGPFQIHPKYAVDADVQHNGGTGDERWYLVPSACGTAKYMHRYAPNYASYDETFVILNHNQGPTGAQNFAAEFKYRYEKLSRGSAKVDDKLRNYVERALALYFIASDMPSFDFDPTRFAGRSMPPKNTLMPPAPIHNLDCRRMAAESKLF